MDGCSRNTDLRRNLTNGLLVVPQFDDFCIHRIIDVIDDGIGMTTLMLEAD